MKLRGNDSPDQRLTFLYPVARSGGSVAKNEYCCACRTYRFSKTPSLISVLEKEGEFDGQAIGPYINL